MRKQGCLVECFLPVFVSSKRDGNSLQDVSSFGFSHYYHATLTVLVEILPNTVPEAEFLSLSDRVILLLASRHVSLTVDKPAPQVLDQILEQNKTALAE